MGSSRLKNELVWSHSRGRAFHDCLRAYWCTYYGSWEGWDAAAPEAARTLYVEKKLTRRPMWVGTRVHEAAEEAIKSARRGRRPDRARAVEEALAAARRDVRDSASGAWLDRPARRVGFAEHHYGEAVTDAEWEAAFAEIERQIHVLFEHRIFRRLLQVPERILDVEELRRFAVKLPDGPAAEVYVALDVLVADGRGGVVIVDWKTGEAHSDETIAAQLGVYGLYVTQELAIPEDRVTALHVNLRHDREANHPVGSDEIRAARVEIAADVREMRALLEDVPQNLADPARYPRRPEGDPRCRRCNFRRSCGREGGESGNSEG